jgi:TRAP-type transport system small permease protein
MIEKVYQYLMKIIEIFVGILITLMVVIVFANVIGRYFLHASVAWSDEVARFMMIWMSLLGAVLAYAKNEHLGLDLVVQAVPKSVAKFINILGDLLVMVAVFMIIKGGYNLVMQNLSWLSPGASISYGFVYTIVPICGVILFLQTILKLVIDVKAVTKREDELC